MEILIDRRESKLAKVLIKLGAKVRVTTLPLGDLEVKDMLPERSCIIERKALDDFVASIVDGRLFDQTKRMYYKEQPCFLLVHGSFNWRHQIHKKQVLGAIASAFVRTGIPMLVFIHFQEKKNTKAESTVFVYNAYVTQKILEKVNQGKFLKPRSYKYKKKRGIRKVEIIAKMFGVSPRVAYRLFKKFGSIQKICLANKQQLFSVTGIGDIRADKIYKLVR